MKGVTPDILDGCKNDDRRALSKLYELLFSLLMGICRRFYINREDRVMQVNNAFLKILQSIKSGIQSGSFEAWCRRIMMNTIIDDYRKNKRQKEIERREEDIGVFADLSLAEYNTAERNCSQEEVERMLLDLPEATRLVFNLFAIDGYPHSEVAQMMGITEGTSKWHVAKARELLKEKLSKRIEANR
jgi:RNA polymerase sigma factor (sigma-70 family)